jgi:hypothetical protein
MNTVMAIDPRLTGQGRSPCGSALTFGSAATSEEVSHATSDAATAPISRPNAVWASGAPKHRHPVQCDARVGGALVSRETGGTSAELAE